MEKVIKGYKCFEKPAQQRRNWIALAAILWNTSSAALVDLLPGVGVTSLSSADRAWLSRVAVITLVEQSDQGSLILHRVL